MTFTGRDNLNNHWCGQNVDKTNKALRSKYIRNALFLLVRPTGFEPVTYGLEVLFRQSYIMFYFM